jgi:hypothetical protein
MFPAGMKAIAAGIASKRVSKGLASRSLKFTMARVDW